MFVDTQVVKNIEGEKVYDRFAIASTMFDVSFKGASCSVIESKVLNSCDGCNLKFLCGKIDEVVEEFTTRTTAVVEKFSFGN